MARKKTSRKEPAKKIKKAKKLSDASRTVEFGFRKDTPLESVIWAETNPLQCPQCPRTFATELMLDNHTNRVHSEGAANDIPVKGGGGRSVV